MDMLMLLSADDIKTLRQSMQMNLREFGEALDVTEATACRWESGARRPQYDDMKKLNALWNKAPRNGHTRNGLSRKREMAGSAK